MVQYVIQHIEAYAIVIIMYLTFYINLREEGGNPKHHLYCCDECIYYAHIDCVITEDKTSLEDGGTENKAEQEEYNDVDGEKELDRVAEACNYKQVTQTMIKIERARNFLLICHTLSTQSTN